MCDVWPDSHDNINHQVPERNEGHKVIKLVRPVHHKTENHHKQIQANQNLDSIKVRNTEEQILHKKFIKISVKIAQNEKKKEKTTKI